ncbi:phosphoribosylaminoimidazole carboxylase [Quercus suber]|uniref:phosphoribosylaminoimidazole carboxylase n=1 Tax=Quercus suber TaxID=58331 RepID=A0AAW0JHY7_QUESU
MQVKIVSAHRTPEMMFSYASSALERGIQIIIAGAGGMVAALIPLPVIGVPVRMVAALTPLPVIGVPVRASALDGLDSLLSIVQITVTSQRLPTSRKSQLAQLDRFYNTFNAHTLSWLGNQTKDTDLHLAINSSYGDITSSLKNLTQPN